MTIRLLSKGEETLLFSIYYSAIHGTAAKDYTSEQIEAWAPKDFDMSEWQKKIQELKPFVVELDGKIIAYADLQEKGYIDHFFVSAEYARKGIGSALMAHLHKTAKQFQIKTLYSHVSKTAEPFFTQHGFSVVKRNLVSVRGVEMENALMEKELNPNRVYRRL